MHNTEDMSVQNSARKECPLATSHRHPPVLPHRQIAIPAFIDTCQLYLIGVSLVSSHRHLAGHDSRASPVPNRRRLTFNSRSCQTGTPRSHQSDSRRPKITDTRRSCLTSTRRSHQADIRQPNLTNPASPVLPYRYPQILPNWHTPVQHQQHLPILPHRHPGGPV